MHPLNGKKKLVSTAAATLNIILETSHPGMVLQVELVSQSLGVCVLQAYSSRYKVVIKDISVCALLIQKALGLGSTLYGQFLRLLHMNAMRLRAIN